MREYDRLQPARFFEKYGGGPSRRYPVCHPDDPERLYPSAAIAQAALGWKDIRGGYDNNFSAATILEHAGFVIIDLSADSGVGALNRTLSRVPATERTAIVKARIGQSVFRAQLDARSGGACEVTGIRDRDLLRASHIRPWSECKTDNQRLDADNGVLLTSLWDAAFDSGLVTFTAEGVATPSSSLSKQGLAALSIKNGKAIAMTATRSSYMDWHRRNWFRP